MKKIEAYIKSKRFHEVMEELHLIDGLTGLTVFDVKGFGRARDNDQPVHIVDNTKNWEPHVKLEVFCTDDLLNMVVTTIQKNAHTGLRGDGKIFISDVIEAIRISTGETGKDSV